MRTYLAFFLMILALTAGLAPVTGLAADTTPEKQKMLGQASSESQTGTEAAEEVKPSTPAAEAATDPFEEEYTDEEDVDDGDIHKEEKVTIDDPIEPFNRAMHVFNDRLYFWILKPVAQGYNVVVPEPARISVKNFFSNLAFPGRFLSCLLQTDFSGAATEAGRFAVNTIWGLGGLLDPAAGPELNLQKQDADLGQTLGVYGVGHGFYIVWPVYGPSSPRDTLTIAGDQLLYPPSYISPWYANLGVWAYEKINYVSLRIGDYESVIGAAIDPYISVRDAYVQYRMKDVKARKAKSMLFKEEKKNTPAADGEKVQIK